MIYITSDLHLGHENVIKYSHRPFSSVEEMNATIIDNWNSRIKSNDEVFLLADFTLQSKISAEKYFSMLNGKIFVTETQRHHDRNWLKKIPYFSRTGAEVRYIPPIYEIKYQKKYFVLSHFPLMSWNKFHNGSFNLHGHSHGNIPDTPRFIDIGVDSWSFYPTTLDQIVSYAAVKAVDNF